MDEKLPRNLGRYRLDVLLGQGGMGEVYKAWDNRLRRWVAIKLLLGDGAGDSRQRARLLREARTAAGLEHSAIIRIFDVSEEDGVDCLVMELVDGPSLAELLRRDGPLDVGLAIDYARQVASGLAAAHTAGIVHGDLKTENVMVLPSGHIKILDFGLARVTTPLVVSADEDASTISRPGRGGTPRAMSPEQAQGDKVDPPSDLFSFGVLLYEILTARSPFRGRSRYEILHQVITHHQRPVRELNRRVPPALSDLVDQLLEKDPDRRPAGAVAVAKVLDRMEAEPPPRSWPDPELPELPYPVLLPYTHPQLFAGRDQDVAELRVKLQVVPIVGLSAPSGAGKTSLLLAGLVPALRADGKPVAVIRHPHEAGVAGRLLADLPEGEAPIDDDDWHGFVDRLREIERLTGEPPVLVLDQFEDVLRLGGAAPTRAALGVLLAATVRRRPGCDAPPCRWLLAYRREYHGDMVEWLGDVLAEARAQQLPDIDVLAHDLTAPERFEVHPLKPLGTPLAGSDPLSQATATFLAAIEAPLALRAEDGIPRYPWRFAPDGAQRLARAFGEARLTRPEAPLTPELQVVLAHLMDQAGESFVMEVPADPGNLIVEALANHLRYALDTAYPAGGRDSPTRRARALLALRELATATGRRDESLSAVELARAIGEGGEEILEQLATPLTRLVVPQEGPAGELCYVLSHDRMAEVVVRTVEEEEHRGKLLVDAELLNLRRFVALETALHRSGEEPAPRIPRRHFRRIGTDAEALLWDDDRRAWWAACRRRRRADRRRMTGRITTAVVILALVATLFGLWAQQRAVRRAPLEQIAGGKPELAFAALDQLASEPDADFAALLALLREREVPMDVLELGLLGVAAEQRSAAVLRAVEIALPWVDATPEDPVLIANLVWALDFVPGREPEFAERAKALRNRVLEPLRRQRPPPVVAEGDADWVKIPGGSFLIGSAVEDGGYDHERPQHQVTISPFCLLRHEVTNEQFRILKPEYEGQPELPAAHGITWYQAYTYAAWLGGRLPTEAEWEYAAGANCAFSYCDREGRKTTVDAVAWTLRNSLNDLSPRPVMKLEPNPWGLYDMLGNVLEWTSDWYDLYSARPKGNPWGPVRPPQKDKSKRVQRGSSVREPIHNARAAARWSMVPGAGYGGHGFRVLLPSCPRSGR